MSSIGGFEIDPRLDLVLARTVDVPSSLVWRAWTEPEHIKPWFCPRPWSLAECEVDLRPGGKFYTAVRSPEGEDMPGEAGCYLEVVPEQRLVWTAALGPGYRPAPESELPFTAAILLAPAGDGGMRYTALAMHRDAPGRERHEAMGFHEGWGAALDQLVEYVKTW